MPVSHGYSTTFKLSCRRACLMLAVSSYQAWSMSDAMPRVLSRAMHYKIKPMFSTLSIHCEPADQEHAHGRWWPWKGSRCAG